MPNEFQSQFLEDLAWWVRHDRKIALRILRLVEATSRNPYSGIGKPEPLRQSAPGIWSRRITQEHRLVYHVKHDGVEFIQARYHY